MATEQGRWVDIEGTDIRVGDRVRRRQFDIYAAVFDDKVVWMNNTHVEVVAQRGGWQKAVSNWQRWESVPEDDHPDWKNVPAEWAARDTLRRGDRWWNRNVGPWITVDVSRAAAVARDKEPRWIKRAPTPTVTEDTSTRSPASRQAEAKQLMAEGHDPRDVLGALDYMITEGYGSATAGLLLREYINVRKACRAIAAIPCYHNRNARTCPYCAITNARSDAQPPETYDGAWETAGEES